MIPERYVSRLRMLLPELEHRMSVLTAPARHHGRVSGVIPQASFTDLQNDPGSPDGHPDPQIQKSTTNSHNESQRDLDTPDFLNPELLDTALKELTGRLARHYPFHHPCYAGQMLKPPHPAAWLAYSLAMTINPNNHALDGGPESSYMEKEVVQELLRFSGFPTEGTGHLTSSGTIANLEALWVARELHPDRPIGISSNAHYTHSRMCRLLRHPFVVIPDGADGLPDPELFDPAGPLPGTVVVTLGTTGLGTVEPLHRITKWAKRNGVRVHVDAAYGGFFHLIRGSGWIDPAPWEALHHADSIVMDPHKHGLQPYGCGSVLFQDAGVQGIYKHDSPYTYFTSDELHLGEISLECSRAGSSAIALWFTLKVLPLDPIAKQDGDYDVDGEVLPSTVKTGAVFGQSILRCRRAALQFYKALADSGSYRPLLKPDLDIVTFLPHTNEKSYSAVSSRSEAILKQGMSPGSAYPLFLSTLEVPAGQAQRLLPDYEVDRDHVNVLRSVLMKPEHLDFLPELQLRLDGLFHQTA